MRADPHAGPEHNSSTSEVLYIDAALTFVDLGMPPCYARPGHTSWHNAEERSRSNHVRFSTESGHAEIAALLRKSVTTEVGRLFNHLVGSAITTSGTTR